MPGSTRSPASLARRARALTVRQAAALGMAALLLGGLVLSAVLGRQAIATALVGSLVMLVLAGQIQARRKMAQEIAAVRIRVRQESEAVKRELAALLERLQFIQRQLLAVVETERLTSTDRHVELMATVDRVTAARRPIDGSGGDHHGVPSQRRG